MSKDVLSQQIIILSRSFDRGSMNQEPPKIDLESSKLLLPLEEAATALSLTPGNFRGWPGYATSVTSLWTGELYFPIEALREWVARNSKRVW